MSSSIEKPVLVGFGNPVMDLLLFVNEDFLKKFNIEKNNVIKAGDQHAQMFQEIEAEKSLLLIPGSSALHTIKIAQWILTRPKQTAFIGSRKRDGFGDLIEASCKKENVIPLMNIPDQTSVPTGKCAILVCGKERSCVCLLGASAHYSLDHLLSPHVWNTISDASYFYFAGFFLTADRDTVLHIAKYCYRKLGRQFCFNLSATYLCELFRDTMVELLPMVDLLFCNRSEAQMFCQVQRLLPITDDTEAIALAIAAIPKLSNPDISRTVVITQDSDDVIVVHSGGVLRRYSVPIIPDEELCDTTAAGDAFAGGFLAEHIQGKDMDTCVAKGIWAAGLIIRQHGGGIPLGVKVT